MRNIAFGLNDLYLCSLILFYQVWRTGYSLYFVSGDAFKLLNQFPFAFTSLMTSNRFLGGFFFEFVKAFLWFFSRHSLVISLYKKDSIPVCSIPVGLTYMKWYRKPLYQHLRVLFLWPRNSHWYIYSYGNKAIFYGLFLLLVSQCRAINIILILIVLHFGMLN